MDSANNRPATDLDRLAREVLAREGEGLVSYYRPWAGAIGPTAAAMLTWLLAREYVARSGSYPAQEPLIYSDIALGNEIGVSGESVRLARLRLARLELVECRILRRPRRNLWRYRLRHEAIRDL